MTSISKYNIPVYVITLKNIEDFKKTKTYISLCKITNKIILIKGVILDKKQEEQYCFYAKSSIGITMAHLKTWKYIIKKQNSLKKNNDYSLIFEDDVILNVEQKDFLDLFNNITKKKFDIYKLHSDFNNGFTSLASYVINNNCINYLLKNYKIILGQPDFDLFVLKIIKNIKILTHPFNIFTTDESDSLNRIDKYNILNLLNFKLCKRSDKTLKCLLCYKVFRILNYEIIAYEIILFFFIVLNFFLCKNIYLFLIFFILLIL